MSRVMTGAMAAKNESTGLERGTGRSPGLE